MERTVPSTASGEIALYLRTIYSLLRSTEKVQIRALEEVHLATNSSLHPDARKPIPDTSAFIYSLLRLPECISEVQTVILGQSLQVFARHGYPDVDKWQQVSARARRRRCYFNHRDTLACLIASRSDIDDLIPTLTAFQIEWNKLHQLLQRRPADVSWERLVNDPTLSQALANLLKISEDDLERLRAVWGTRFAVNLQRIAHRTCNISVRLLSGSLTEYRRATRAWWENVVRAHPELLERPVYFVSSNTHSMANLLSGYALVKREELIRFLYHENYVDWLEEWRNIEQRQLQGEENFLYYILKKYQQTPKGRYTLKEQLEHEKERGIYRIPSENYFDIEVQVIRLSALKEKNFDPRIRIDNMDFLAQSNALILNIDYPLGLGAYNLLSLIAEYIEPILGVYIMGKAATLNGRLGDVMIPNVVQDEHSQNTYLFQNCFSASDVSPHLIFGTVLDNQKAVSVFGTFLQNARIMDVVYREGYTDIEMEAGPYLSAIYEMTRPKRHPVNEIVSLYNLPFDVGILHYASDTPLSKGKNLGAGTLSYFGMDSTYATTIAILKRIFSNERTRLT